MVQIHYPDIYNNYIHHLNRVSMVQIHYPDIYNIFIHHLNIYTAYRHQSNNYFYIQNIIQLLGPCYKTVTSPNYPQPYYPNLHKVRRFFENISFSKCFTLQNWTLSVPKGARLLLTFTDFSLEEPHCFPVTNYCYCHKDWLEVSYEGFKQRYCGKTLPPPVNTNSNVTLLLHTNHCVNRRGFHARYGPI